MIKKTATNDESEKQASFLDRKLESNLYYEPKRPQPPNQPTKLRYIIEAKTHMSQS